MISKKIGNQNVIETDVAIIGYGGAGATAAITAHDNGADVIILEKMPVGGGSTFLASGGILIPTAMDFAKYLKEICAGTTPDEVIETFVQHAMKIEEYIHEIGGESESMDQPGNRDFISASCPSKLAKSPRREIYG